jgi:hypothetical protein
MGTWPTTIFESGSRLITTTRASSQPQSLLTSVGAATSTSSQQIALQWRTVGSTFASSVSITADISPLNFVGVAPPWSGSIALLCASFGSFGSNDACFSYTRGRDLSFANDYVGYFIEHTGGPGFRYHCPLTGNLASNLWSRVELRLTRNPGTVQVFINGTSGGATCSPSFLDDTMTEVSFGLRAHPETQGWNVYYDNVVAAVRR